MLRRNERVGQRPRAGGGRPLPAAGHPALAASERAQCARRPAADDPARWWIGSTATVGGLAASGWRVNTVLNAMVLLRGGLVATVLACSAPVGFAQGQTLGPQLSIEQVQRWCFEDGQSGCQGDWLQLQPNRVQFSSGRCDTVFILPAVVQQIARGNLTPALVVVDSAPPELQAPAHRSGNVRVLTDICMIELEAS